MTIEAKITFKNAAELHEFATWYDKAIRHKAVDIKRRAASEPKPVQFDPPPAEPKAEPKPAPKAEPKPKPAPKAEPIVVMKTEDFAAAIKTWFAADAVNRGPVVKKMLESLGAEKLTDVPADQFAAVLARLGVA